VDTDDRAPGSDRMHRALDLIQAVAAGEAETGDIAAQLRGEGYDVLELAVAALAGAARQAAGPRAFHRPIDVRTFAQPTPPELVATTVHRPPTIPFLLNGTLYDPQDISRFDGQELHLIDVRGQLMAFDDRATIARTWELLFVVPALDAGRLAPTGGPMTLTDDMGPVPWPWWPEVDEVGAYFYSDSGWDDWGDELYLPLNHGYWRLSQVCRGFLCTGDWNDVISAFRCFSTWVPDRPARVCILHEHINMGGSSFTNVAPAGGRECYAYKELNSVGWNDRASSVEAW